MNTQRSQALAARWVSGALAAVAVGVMGMVPGIAGAQAQAPGRDEASLVVEGVVREVFRSERRSATDYLLLIEVSDAQLGPNRRSRVFVPAPGESIYVHLSGSREPAAERSKVRVQLASRPGGGAWDVAGGLGGIERLGNDLAEARAGDSEPARPEAAPVPTQAPTAPGRSEAGPLERLGIQAETLPVSGRIVLRVTAVAADSPGAKAGLEKGDVIVGVDGKPFTRIEELDRLLRASAPEPTLVVLNVRNNESTPVKVQLPNPEGAEAPAPSSRPSPTPTPTPATPTLGVGVKPVRAGRQSGLQVTEVTPDTPAGKAGLEVGDVIVTANGKPTTSSEELASALRSSGPKLQLEVVNVQNGKVTPVEVALGGMTGRPSPIPSPTTPTTPTQPGATAPAGGLGVTTEQTVQQLVPALKVTAVQSGSPAERAGLEVGDVIFAANDTVTIVPDLLEQAVTEAKGGALKLTVLDPRTGKRTEVNVDLGGRR
jgi:S1-C subfamily serine protease